MMDAQQVSTLNSLFSPPDWSTLEEFTTASTIAFRAVDMIILIAYGLGTTAVAWQELQSTLHTWCSDHKDVAEIDPYLFIVVNTFDEATAADLRAAVDDRYVCRKIAIILDGRALDVALRDYWLFRNPSTIPAQPFGIETAPPLRGLSQLRDLLQPPEVVAEHLLARVRDVVDL